MVQSVAFSGSQDQSARIGRHPVTSGLPTGLSVICALEQTILVPIAEPFELISLIASFSVVKALNKEGESEPLAIDQYVQIKDPWDEPGKPGRPEITDYDSDRIGLAWEPPPKDGDASIEEYIVEKDPVTREWVECARSPMTTALVRNLKEGEEYHFYVIYFFTRKRGRWRLWRLFLYEIEWTIYFFTRKHYRGKGQAWTMRRGYDGSWW